MSGSRATSQAYDFLRRVPVFQRLGTRSLRKLVRLCVERTYEAGAEIITEGSTGLGLFVITSGEVEVFKRSDDDRVVLARLERGAVLGELALIDAQPRSASAVALTDTTCLLITRSGFHDLVQREPDIAWCFVPVLAGRMRDLQTRVMASAGHLGEDEVDRINGVHGLHGPHLAHAAANLETPPAAAGRAEAQPADRSQPADKIQPADQIQPAADDEPRRSPLAEESVHAQHALARAGLTALDGGVRTLGAMLDTLYDETIDRSDPEKGRDADTVASLRHLPAGLARAATAGIKEAERIPERMITTLRHHLRRGARPRGRRE